MLRRPPSAFGRNPHGPCGWLPGTHGWPRRGRHEWCSRPRGTARPPRRQPRRRCQPPGVPSSIDAPSDQCPCRWSFGRMWSRSSGVLPSDVFDGNGDGRPGEGTRTVRAKGGAPRHKRPPCGVLLSSNRRSVDVERPPSRADATLQTHNKPIMPPASGRSWRRRYRDPRRRPPRGR